MCFVKEYLKNMKNKKILIIIILFCICVISGVAIILNSNKEEKQIIKDNEVNQNIITNVVNKESERKVVSNMKVIIKGNEYNAVLEENQTAKSFINMLPKEFNMSELNGNEKYVYLDKVLPTNEYKPKMINKGDVMLYQDNCLVLFYKDFETSYRYTKIGHIKDLDDLDYSNISVTFTIK